MQGNGEQKLSRQQRRVLNMLRSAGPRGVTNGEFMKAGIGQAGTRRFELKKMGCEILSSKITNSRWAYTLIHDSFKDGGEA